MKNKVILGTVQLGLPYGINNTSGRPSRQEAFDILNYAFDQGITTLDSADNYGEALAVIGEFRKTFQKDFKIINKFKIDDIPLADKLRINLSTLGQPSLFCYMFHQFTDYSSGKVREALKGLKKDGLIQSIGVSVYSSSELGAIVEDELIDIVQLPVNILDMSAEKNLLLARARECGKEIHARSIFLQGLLFKEPQALSGNLIDLHTYIEQLNYRAKSLNVSVKKLALNYIFSHNLIDKIVLGVEQVQQLQDNLGLIDPNFKSQAMDEIRVLPEHRYLLNPVNWKL